MGTLGFYECLCMSFGLMNAPATFQHLKETGLGDLHLNGCILYLDDIIIFSRMPEEHTNHLWGVFEKLAKVGLKLKPCKHEFFKTHISFLGHIVSSEGIETDPSKIDAILRQPHPWTITDVQSFLGFTNHYHWLIKYVHIAWPLNQLISGENAGMKREPVNWNPAGKQAFLQLKDICSKMPVLAYANFSQPFWLHTDASEVGLGAVLYQNDNNGKRRVVAFANHCLSHSEKWYPGHTLDFLTLKWDITDRYHEYLYGETFDVYTDNNPLMYILTMAQLEATGQRWVASLANYNFVLHYRSGKSNVYVDALPRIPWEVSEMAHSGPQSC